MNLHLDRPISGIPQKRLSKLKKYGIVTYQDLRVAEMGAYVLQSHAEDLLVGILSNNITPYSSYILLMALKHGLRKNHYHTNLKNIIIRETFNIAEIAKTEGMEDRIENVCMCFTERQRNILRQRQTSTIQDIATSLRSTSTEINSELDYIASILFDVDVFNYMLSGVYPDGPNGYETISDCIEDLLLNRTHGLSKRTINALEENNITTKSGLRAQLAGYTLEEIQELGGIGAVTAKEIYDFLTPSNNV